MIRIDQLRLRMPGQSEDDARELVSRLERILAERVDGDFDEASLGRLELTVSVDPDADTRTVAHRVADALLGAISREEVS